jgi:ribosomal protein S18 acetylase RimI-like enzyme
MDTHRLRVVPCDFSRSDHRKAVAELTNGYIRDQMGGGKPLSLQESERLVELLASYPTAFVLIAEVDGIPAGLLTAFEYIATFTVRPMLYIHDLFVDHSHRGCGLARQLMEAVIDEARRRGCSRLALEVRDDNTHAQSLYHKLGFRLTSPLMHYQRLELSD